MMIASKVASGSERYVSPARASQMLSYALGHGYSRQSIVRLLEAGILTGHQMTKRGRWWVLSSSLKAYTQSILEWNAAGDVLRSASISESSQRSSRVQ